VTKTSGEQCDKGDYFFVLLLLWVIRKVETPFAPITEIPFFVSKDSRSLFVMSFFKPLKQDGQQSPLKCFHFRRPKTSRNQQKLAKPWVEDYKELKENFFLLDLHTYDSAAVFPAYDVITSQARSHVSWKLIVRQSKNCVFWISPVQFPLIISEVILKMKYSSNIQ